MFKVLTLTVSLYLFLSAEVSARERYANLTASPGELCSRTCVENEHKVCYFKFVLEHYSTMGSACKQCAKGVPSNCDHTQCVVADGIERGAMSINRMIPGPAIHVCKGDMVIVDVLNNAHGTAASLHWHGMHMRKTPHMDGVPYATQCPIRFASTFRYAFEASESGTKFYHSHAGHHKANGQYGALIIREPEKQTYNFKEYNFDLPEHYILISDWTLDYGENKFPGLSDKFTLPSSLLLNGRGSYIEPKTLKIKNIPVTKYFVEPGKRYRFRVINSMSHTCPAQIQIEGHNMIIISSDSSDVVPQEFNTLSTNSGERYDFILTANHTQGDFWIRIKALGQCSTRDPMDVFGLLRYKTNDEADDLNREQPPFPSLTTTYPSDIKLNDPTAFCLGNSTNYCVNELTALDADEDLLFGTPDQKIFLSFNIYITPNEKVFRPGHFDHFLNIIGNDTALAAINNISVVFPPYPPLTQPNDIDESEFCDENKKPKKCDGEQICPCVHRIKVQKNNLVEMIIVDESDGKSNTHHPFHLHGYNVMVTGMGQHPSRIPMTLNLAKQMEGRGVLPRHYHNNRPPFKDTISIPNRGYAILRFRADNPGFWLLHCHYEWHLAGGMGLLMQVGEPRQMIVPPKDFPKCNHYVPKVKMPRF